MSAQLDLEQIERKAFRSMYQDGLWDVYFGLMVISMAMFMFRPIGGYSPVNILLLVSGFGVSYLVFWLGKKFVTLPRMGQVKFGEVRKRRKRTLMIILCAVVLIQASFVLFQVLAWLTPDVRESLNSILLERRLMDLIVASLGALFIGPSMMLIAYFKDFPRGYYIAVMMMLAVFLMIYLNRPIYPILIGGLIALPGLALFVRFLRKYPLPREESPHEHAG